MTVVERRERNGSRDQFPVGMRVLAVDDDPTCLKVLETLLHRCQYHVTTTNQAIRALEMLRENKDQFDLVISDVHMPDMDGFKLLELVGLEMDLPVIMLSANGETQAVMKGITHGACDYLLKPVRIEELKNIWQHVIRRKKFDPKDPNNLDSGDDCDKNELANSEGAQGSFPNGSSDRDAKLNRKRKDQNDDDEDDGEDSLHENDDPSAQKKPRVVWSVELHRKFVAAVNQLGIDKAVPKRILDLMNVERLTRENVASHLQKYRLYLKRLSAVANQQANMVAALRGRDASYLPMGSLDAYANFNSLVGSRPLPARTSFQSNGTLPRMNSFTGFGLHGFAPSGATQLSRNLNNPSNSINDVGKLQGIGLPTLPANQQGTLIQGMPTPLDLDKLQQPRVMQEASSRLLGGFSGNGVAASHSANSFNSTVKSPHMFQANQQQTQSGGLSNQQGVRIQPISSDPFEIGIGESSHSVDLGRCNEIWQSAIPSTTYPGNTVPTSLPLGHNDLSSVNVRDNISPMISQLGSRAGDVSSSSAVMAPLTDPVIRNDGLANVQSHPSSLITTAGINGDANLLTFRSIGNSSSLKWEEPGQCYAQNSNLVYNSPSSSSTSNIRITNQSAGNQNLDNGFSTKKLDMPNFSQTSFGTSSLLPDSRRDRAAVGSQSHYKDERLFEDMKVPGGFSSGSFGLDDLIPNAMVKPECDDFTFIDGDMGCNDLYSLGACM